MKSTSNFPGLLEGFFTQRLLQQKQASTHTIASYRDTFRLLFRFTEKRLHKTPSQLKGRDQWRVDLFDQVLWDGTDPKWLDYPAMMKIPVSSPAVLGRLKGFCEPFDFVLAPILRSDKLNPEERAEKPILITRFNKHSDEWLDTTYYNVRTGKKCRITVGDPKNGRIPVKTYQEILRQYLYHPESKFAGPDGRPCDPWTRGILQRRHIIAADFKYCGKEVKRKLEQGPVDHETDFKAKVYANGRVTADDGTLRALGNFSERVIHKGTGLSRRIIRNIRHHGQVKPSTMQRITDFLARKLEADGQFHALERRKPNASQRSLGAGHKVKTPVR